jgi:O-acetylhomoserine (thiol)-lyase
VGQSGLEFFPVGDVAEIARSVVHFLQEHSRVAWVNYPGFPGSNCHVAANNYLNGGYGCLLGLGVKTGFEGAKRIINAPSLFSHLANIGDARSLAIHPASTNHSQLASAEQACGGVQPDHIRPGLGCEDFVDLRADLEQALARVRVPSGHRV